MKIYNVGSRIVNNYIYKAPLGYVMIDTGYENSLNYVIKKMKKLEISLLDIKYIFLTHAHDDHAGFLNEILNMNPNIKVIVNPESIKILQKGQNSFLGGCSGILALIFCNMMKLFGNGGHYFPPLEEKNLDRLLSITNENKSQLEETLCGKIFYTKGHTFDSISLMTNDGIFFCGDSTMNGLPSLNRITIWIENKKDFIETWKNIIEINPSIIYPAHGNPFKPKELEKNIKKLEKIKLYSLK